MTKPKPPELKANPSYKYMALKEAKVNERIAKMNAAKALKKVNGLTTRVHTAEKRAYRQQKKLTEANDVKAHQVAMLVSQGWLRPQIARFLGISENILRRDYAEQLNYGDTVMNSKVSRTLYDIATDKTHKNVATCAIFIAKTRMGWSDRRTIDVNLPGLPKAAEKEATVIDPRSLSAEQRDVFRSILISAIQEQADRETEDEDFIDAVGHEVEEHEAEE